MLINFIDVLEEKINDLILISESVINNLRGALLHHFCQGFLFKFV